jgi:CRISPR-associated protein Cas2
MFDLPVTTVQGRREYNQFRKFLVKEGYFMMQESVYCKLAPNQNAANAMIMVIKSNKPSEGLVQILTVTEKQYNDIVFIVGENNSDVISSTDRLIEL